MLVAIYLRVSHRDSLDGKSLDVQEAACREKCAARGWIVVGVYQDEAKSATSMRRPELKRLLADVKARGIQAVVVYELDRAFRNLRDQLNTWHDFQAAGVALHAVIDQIDTTTPEGVMQFQLKGMVSEYQAAQTGRKIRATLSYKAERGLWIGPPPFGAQVGADGRLAPNDDTPIVCSIFERYATGAAALADVAHDLNMAGYLFRDWTGRTGLFLQERIRSILNNRAYIGYVGERPNCHPPLIDPGLWERANAIREQRSSGRGRVTVRSETNLGALSGMACCARCGGPLWHQRCGPVGKRYGYYYCGNRRTHLACDAPLCPIAACDEMLLQWLDDLAFVVSDRARITEAAARYLQQAAPQPDRSGVRTDLHALKVQFLADEITSAVYEQRRREIESRLRTPQQAAPVAISSADIDALQSIGTLARAAEPGERRALVRLVLQHVWLERSSVVALTPTPRYFALTAAVVEYREGQSVPKRDCQHQLTNPFPQSPSESPIALWTAHHQPFVFSPA